MIKKFKIFNFKNFKNNTSKRNTNSQIQFHLSQTWKKFLPAAFGGGILQAVRGVVAPPLGGQ